MADSSTGTRMPIPTAISCGSADLNPSATKRATRTTTIIATMTTPTPTITGTVGMATLTGS